MRFRMIMILSVMAILGGCSGEAEVFNDENIRFAITDAKSNGGLSSHTIKISNKTGFELQNLSLELRVPTAEGNSEKFNEVVLRVPEEFTIDSGETKKFRFLDTDIGDVGHTDLEELIIELNGNASKGNTETPFGIVGSLLALSGSP
ncbi:hypothetical protein [Planococcus lenghuensis]|uniref:Lipoprotein n=1 Tax=Planococcus lenghuensis TaxID=2213202 RepID=A0A1Q2KZ55_9BACL|nr:hypothetical protein [Planococcus lenghuensis]AQQ53471.1 hypothetical protein B0X71_10560 [Planococcus lenghuensis]